MESGGERERLLGQALRRLFDHVRDGIGKSAMGRVSTDLTVLPFPVVIIV